MGDYHHRTIIVLEGPHVKAYQSQMVLMRRFWREDFDLDIRKNCSAVKNCSASSIPSFERPIGFIVSLKLYFNL